MNVELNEVYQCYVHFLASDNSFFYFTEAYITTPNLFKNVILFVTASRKAWDSFIMFRCYHLRVESEDIFRSAIQAVNPKKLVLSNLSVRGDVLKVAKKEYVLKKKCYLVGFGKATYEMAITAANIIGDKLEAGVISVPHGSMIGKEHPREGTKLKFIEGAKNNLPDKDAEVAAKEILELALKLDEEDMLLVLISGGGSALLPLPLTPITLEEKTKVITLLASAGASITELNAVRRCLSLIKGGGLAKAAYPARVAALILSDIVGDPLDLIASGPTVAPSKDVPIAWDVISKYGLGDKIPKSIYECLHSKKPWAPVIYSHVDNVVVGNNGIAISAALREARSRNYSTVVLSTAIQGLVPTVALFYTSLACHICSKASPSTVQNFIKNSEPMIGTSLDAPALISAISEAANMKGLCIIAGGETTIEVKGTGVGGRNQELALTFSLYIQEALKNIDPQFMYDVLFLSAGTDGIDGPTQAAGAVAYRGQLETWEGTSPKEYLANNDSYNFFKQLNDGNDLVITGHTGTNVMDLHILMLT